MPDSAADFSRVCRELKAAGPPTAAVETPPVNGVAAKTGFVRCVDSLVCRGIRINRRDLEAEVFKGSCHVYPSKIHARPRTRMVRRWGEISNKGL